MEKMGKSIEMEGKFLYNGDVKETNVRNGWFCCPVCHKRLFPVTSETRVRRLPYKCKACRTKIEVNIEEPRAIEPRAD